MISLAGESPTTINIGERLADITVRAEQKPSAQPVSHGDIEIPVGGLCVSVDGLRVDRDDLRVRHAIRPFSSNVQQRSQRFSSMPSQ